jgi:hypothetical protein
MPPKSHKQNNRKPNPGLEGERTVISDTREAASKAQGAEALEGGPNLPEANLSHTLTIAQVQHGELRGVRSYGKHLNVSDTVTTVESQAAQLGAECDGFHPISCVLVMPDACISFRGTGKALNGSEEAEGSSSFQKLHWYQN